MKVKGKHIVSQIIDSYRYFPEKLSDLETKSDFSCKYRKVARSSTPRLVAPQKRLKA